MSLALATQAAAQWQKVPDKNVPRVAGKPNLAAPAPRIDRRTPDLSGVWLPDPDPNGKPAGLEQIVFPRAFIDVTAEYPRGEIALQPKADEIFRQRLASGGKDMPAAYCKPSGMPGVNAAPLPYKIVQTPKLILILYEGDTDFRQIFLDGRKPVDDPLPRWMGYSTGRWDGDTLVVDTTNLTDLTGLGGNGRAMYHSGVIHLVERFTRLDPDTMQYEATVEDLKTWTRPFTISFQLRREPDYGMFEYACHEGNYGMRNILSASRTTESRK
jgi:hypothetical protein